MLFRSTLPSLKPELMKRSALTLRGVEGVAIQYARCCRPVPGDKIIGFITRGRGVSVHSVATGNRRRTPTLSENCQ